MTDIAIVGLGCRFPGAPDIRTYWKLLMSAERQFSAVPGERWNHGTFHEPGNRSAPNASYTDQVAFLEDLDRFDAAHYGVPPARARAMDPQHRLMLDVTREALADAGMGRGDFDRENTGVFFGISVSDYKDLMTAPLRAITLAEDAHAADDGAEAAGAADAAKERARQLGTIDAFTLPGSLLNMAAGTVSRHFDLGGPSFAVDAACSGSLVALDQAIAQVRSGSCRIALVGGVYLNLTPDSLVGFSRLRALSAAGVCRPFDAEADGFVLGEGAGVVVIRPLADALAEGDRVYAVIKGIGSANDGASPGPLVPTAEGQLRAMRRAYEDAGVAPSSVGFLEAHGTGTAAGDRAESEALRRLRTEYPDDDPALCYLGAGKALIGHSLAAAGIAGLIKTALVVHHRTIVPQPTTTLHPDLGISAAGLRFAASALPFPETGAGTPRRAAVSSFGFGGTNVHVVLEERQPDTAPGRLPDRTEDAGGTGSTGNTEDAGPHLVLLSAGNAELLDRHIGDVLDALDTADRGPLAAVAHTLGSREPLTARLAIVAAGTDAFVERLRHAREQLLAGARGDLGEGAFAADAPLPAAQRRVAFLFPGQGSQRPGMMRDLHQRFPAFRSAVAVLDAVARGDVGFDLSDLLYGDEARSHGDTEELRKRLAATDVCQPLLGTVQIATTRVLADCGIRPDLALGHSAGEFAAAAAAGALTSVDTVRLLVHRGATLRQAESRFPGGMLAVQTDEETCRRLTNGIDGVWLACFNQPRQIVVSGTPEGLAALCEACAEAGIVTAALDVSRAFHSPHLAAVEDTIRSGLTARPIACPVVPFVSSVNGEVCSDPGRLRELWTRHASAPVLFGDAVRTAYDQGARVFLQVTGGNSLLTSVRRNLTGHGDVHVVPVEGTADGGRTFVLALARLAVLGVPVDPRALIAEEDRRLLDLPVAGLATQSYWVPARRTAKQAPAAASLPAQPVQPVQPVEPAQPEETSMNAPTYDPANPPMDELLQLVRQQAELLARITATLPAPMATGAAVPAAAVPEESEVPAAAPADLPAPHAAADEVTSEVTGAVLAQVARISAFPVEQLSNDQLLIDDLGFDSLMLTDLFASLNRQWPQWAFDERAADRPTVARLAASITGACPDATAAAAVPGPRAGHGDGTPSAAVADLPQVAMAPAPPAAADSPRLRVVPTPAGRPTDDPAAPEEHTRIDRFPEVAAHGERIGTLAGLGLANPYFLVHEAGMTDTTVIDGRELVSFSSYNYLGMATDPKVKTAAQDAVERYGTSVSASRLLSGSRPLHLELETELAGLLGCESALTLANGHATNVTVIGHLIGPGDLVLHDSLAHDSILQGCKLSGATRRPFPHNDAAALDALLAQVRHQYRRVLIVIEGVYSMDGDIADLPALLEVKHRHGALLMIDEAHSIGTIGATGRGIGEYHGTDRSAVDLWSGTLSKALASCGGYVAGSRTVIEYLRYTVPGFVYSAGMTPADTAASLTALRLLRAEPERVARLSRNAALFVRLAREAGVDVGDSHDTPVVPCIVGDSLKTLKLAEALFRQGISVNPILYPAVPEEMARLRFFITSDHTPGQIRQAVTALERELRQLDADTATAASPAA